MLAATLRAFACWTAIVLAFAFASLAQETANNGQKLSSTTELVLVPVVVHDKSGAHVSGLQADDFQVSEGGKPQSNAIFEEVKASTARPRRPPAVSGVYSNQLQQDQSNKRVVVIALDQVNSAYLDQARARQQLTQHLVEAVGDGDLTALVKIHSRGVTVLHDFTSDPRILMAGLRAALAVEKGDISLTELDKVDPAQLPRSGDVADFKKLMLDGNFNMNTIKEFFDGYHQKMAYMEQSAAIRATLDAMEHIAHALAGLPGRKSLIWLTGSFPLSLNPSSEILDGQGAAYFRRTIQALNDAGVAVYPVDIRGVVNEAEGLDDPYPTQGSKRRRNYETPEVRAEDPSKLRFEAMRGFASSTGGLAFYNNNDVQNGIRGAIADSSAYYMLGYYRAEKSAGMQWKTLNVKARLGVAGEEPQWLLHGPHQRDNLDDGTGERHEFTVGLYRCSGLGPLERRGGSGWREEEGPV